MDEKIADICTIVEKESEVGETLWIVIDNQRVQIRLGALYAPQESRTTIEEYKTLYQRLEGQIEQGKARNQKLLLLGDFNCKVGNLIDGNKSEVSKSGKLMIQMIKKMKMTMVNSLDEQCSGLWTRAEGESKSVLDYALVWKDETKLVRNVNIDEDRELSPRGYVDGKITYSDHNVITFEIDWLLLEKTTPKAERKILTKKGEIRSQLEMEERKVSEILEKGTDVQKAYTEWKETITQIVERNKTVVRKSNPRKGIRELIKRKKQIKKATKKCSDNKRKRLIGMIKLIDADIEKERKEQFGNKIGKVVGQLRSSKGINGPNMWEVLKKVRRRKAEPPAAIKDKEGNILEDPEKIKNRYLEHFRELLAPVEAESEEGKKQEELIDIAFDRVIATADKEETRYTTTQEILDARKELKKKKCRDGTGWNNEMLLGEGDEMVKSLKKIYNMIEEERIVPGDWQKVIVKAISKPGPLLEMDYKRGLFLTDVISKLYEKILKNRNKQQINQYISPYQTGGVKGKTTVDHIMVLSEIIRRNRKMGRKTYVVFGDAVKCFDKLWLKDSLMEMVKAGCNLQDIQMMYKLNEETEITVETPLGQTESTYIGETVKQGTVLGPEMCCVTIDQVNNIGENQEKAVGEVMVGILVFVDDVMSAGTAEEIRKAIRNFAEMEKLKKVTYGLKKTKYMIMNTGKELDEEIAEKVKGGMVGETAEYKYVGLWLNKEGNLKLHIENKKKKIKGQISAMKSLASYYNVGDVFVLVRLQLFEVCIIPSILYNIEGWNHLTKKELAQLEMIQHQALCTLLDLPKTTPYIALLNEVGMWRMEERLSYRRIMLYHNIVHSEETRLIKKMIEQQEREEEDFSWYVVTKENMKRLEIDITTVKDLSKSQLKNMVKTRITERMKGIAIATKNGSTKMRFSSCSSFQMKSYVKFGDGNSILQTLKTRLNMWEVYGNFKGNYRLPRLCPHCQKEDDTTEHLILCPALGPTNFAAEDIEDEENVELWRQMLERISTNMKWREARRM